MSDQEAICCQVKLKNRRVRITTNGETFVIRWKRLMSDRSIKITEAILTREAAEATMLLLSALLKETEKDQIAPCKRPDLCMLDEGHIPCPVCPNDPSIAPSLACSAFERAAQICRYYLKHQNHPSRWDDKSDYEQGVQIACENLAVLMLEEVGKFKVEAGSSLEELAANWERAGFGNVAVAIRDSEQNAKGDLSAVAD